MDLGKARRVLESLREPPYRLDQLRRAVFSGQAATYEEVTTLPAHARRELAASAPVLSIEPRRVEVSADGRAHKAVLALSDGKPVESVLLRPSPRRWTACLSCQAGCAVGCSFCATGLMGPGRDMTPEEIADQVLFWRQYMRRQGLPGRLDNVVYMGMGEPFHAYESVCESLRLLLDPRLYGMGARRIAVSTAGIAPKIERFGSDFPQVNLALSLHAADDALRDKLVPLNKAYPLARLAASLRRYLEETSRKVFLEYVLLRGENDRPADADRLAAWCRSVGPLPRLHVNLIVFNQTDTPHRPTDEADARRFQARLLAAGLKSTVRQNLGRDIQGACGQLIVAKEEPASP